MKDFKKLLSGMNFFYVMGVWYSVVICTYNSKEKVQSLLKDFHILLMSNLEYDEIIAREGRDSFYFLDIGCEYKSLSELAKDTMIYKMSGLMNNEGVVDE